MLFPQSEKVGNLGGMTNGNTFLTMLSSVDRCILLLSWLFACRQTAVLAELTRRDFLLHSKLPAFITVMNKI